MWWCVFIVLWMLVVLGIQLVCGYVENAHDTAKRSDLLLQYITCLHMYGVNSDEARDFKLGQKDDENFLKRAEAMDEIFRTKQRVDIMWGGS